MLARFLGVRPKRQNRDLCRLYPNSEECFWLCVDAVWQYRQHVSQEGQVVISLNSGEAESYGFLSATSEMCGLQCILLDWRWKFDAHVWMEATAGIAIGSRRVKLLLGASYGH